MLQTGRDTYFTTWEVSLAQAIQFRKKAIGNLNIILKTYPQNLIRMGLMKTILLYSVSQNLLLYI